MDGGTVACLVERYLFHFSRFYCMIKSQKKRKYWTSKRLLNWKTKRKINERNKQ
jgi:hypothetical protein